MVLLHHGRAAAGAAGVRTLLGTPPAATFPSPTAETEKWLTTNDAQWRADYDRTVAKPYEKGLADIRRPYLAALELPMTQALRGARPEEAAMWRGGARPCLVGSVGGASR